MSYAEAAPSNQSGSPPRSDLGTSPRADATAADAFEEASATSPEELAQAAIHAASARLWSGRTRRSVTVEDEPDGDDLELENQRAGQQAAGEEDVEYEYVWGTEDYDADKYAAISVWDELSELFLRMGQTSGACLYGWIKVQTQLIEFTLLPQRMTSRLRTSHIYDRSLSR